MSRIGKQPITVPQGTEVTLEGGLFTVKGPKGQLSRQFKDDVEIMITDGVITLKPANDSRFAYALWGTYASHILNMVTGVNTPYEKKLVIEGVGYRAAVEGKQLVLKLGYSHDIKEEISDDLTVLVEKNVITITGIDKEKVGQFAARTRAYRKPEPYKGKGVRYSDEIVKRKEGKRAV